MNFVPHSGQNFAFAETDLPQFGQFIVRSAGGVSCDPHSGQNFEVAGTLEEHLGQITNAAAGAWAGP